jgi:FkbM family methyltransferase
VGRLKSSLVRQAEKWANVRIVRPDMLYVLPERDHLSRFFKHFAVDCVFDVGANTGQYGRMLRHFVRFDGPIVSFEPIPALAEVLRTRAAADPAWHVEQIALDSTEREASFHVMEYDQFSSLHAPSTDQPRVFTSKNKVREVIAVRTTTLQRQLETFQEKLGFKRPFLKLDTQGHDLDVARGAGPSLNRFVGIQSELAIKPLYAGAPDFREALDFYAARGFELSAFVPNNAGHFPALIETDCILYRLA